MVVMCTFSEKPTNEMSEHNEWRKSALSTLIRKSKLWNQVPTMSAFVREWKYW